MEHCTNELEEENKSFIGWTCFLECDKPTVLVAELSLKINRLKPSMNSGGSAARSDLRAEKHHWNMRTSPKLRWSDDPFHLLILLPRRLSLCTPERQKAAVLKRCTFLGSQRRLGPSQDFFFFIILESLLPSKSPVFPLLLELFKVNRWKQEREREWDLVTGWSLMFKWRRTKKHLFFRLLLTWYLAYLLSHLEPHQCC